MTISRKLVKTDTPKATPGFLGPGHLARPVISGPFSESDPFIALMDDWLDKKDSTPVGGPHPHAGFETVSLLLEGEIGDAAHKMKSGDFQIMTAGSGIIHTETIEKKAKMRLLQMWLTLPKKDRWATPRVQDIPLEHVPKSAQNGVEITLYSGSLAGLHSPVQNYTPLIAAHIKLQPGAATTLQVPANYNTFLYVLQGNISVGEAHTPLNQDQVGWLDRFAEETQSDLVITAGQAAAHLVLYAGQPQGEHIVSHGPFIGDTSEDIVRLYQAYRQGKMQHISTVPQAQKITL